MNKPTLFTVLCLFFSILLTGCSQSSTVSPTMTPSDSDGIVNQYPSPYPDSQPIQPLYQDPYPPQEYPEPGSSEASLNDTNFQIPEPKPDSAIIVGKLLEDGEPIFNATIYLADVLQDNATGEFKVASYSRQTSPRAEVDQDGQFVFADVKPGKYSLIIDNFSTYFSLNDPSASDQPLILSAEAGKTTDLGELDYPDFPEL